MTGRASFRARICLPFYGTFDETAPTLEAARAWLAGMIRANRRGRPGIAPIALRSLSYSIKPQPLEATQ